MALLGLVLHKLGRRPDLVLILSDAVAHYFPDGIVYFDDKSVDPLGTIDISSFLQVTDKLKNRRRVLKTLLQIQDEQGGYHISRFDQPWMTKEVLSFVLNDQPKQHLTQFRFAPLWRRWDGYVRGISAEPLLSLAYCILSALESSATKSLKKKKRERAAEEYNIHLAILDKLGELTAEGTLEYARKIEGQNRPLTTREFNWIDAVIPLLLQRIQLHQGGQLDAAVPFLQMSDLPIL